MNRVQLLLGTPHSPTHSPAGSPSQQLLRRQRPQIPSNRRLPDSLRDPLDRSPAPSPQRRVRDLTPGRMRKPLGSPPADRPRSRPDHPADRAGNRRV